MSSSKNIIPWTEELAEHVTSMVFMHDCKKDSNAIMHHFLDKCLQVFHYIYDKVQGDLKAQEYIKCQELRKISYQYKDILRALYNCNLIFYNEGENGEISHGFSTITHTFFCGCYALSSELLNEDGTFNKQVRSQLSFRNGCWRGKKRNHKTKRENIILNRHYIENFLGVKVDGIEKMNKNEIDELVKEIRAHQDAQMHGESLKWETQYTMLMFDDGTPFNCGLPRHGKYPLGRIYCAFTSLLKELRCHLMYNGNHLVEVGDIKSCFVKLIASLSDDHDLIKEVRESDIYLDCISEMKLKCSRNDIKPYFQKYILAKPQDVKNAMCHKHDKNQPALMSAVFNFMKKNFPKAHDYVMNSPLVNFNYLDGNLALKTKKVKALMQTLQEKEACVIHTLRSLCKGTTFTVHDSILSDRQEDFDFQHVSDLLIFQNNFDDYKEEFEKIRQSYNPEALFFKCHYIFQPHPQTPKEIKWNDYSKILFAPESVVPIGITWDHITSHDMTLKDFNLSMSMINPKFKSDWEQQKANLKTQIIQMIKSSKEEKLLQQQNQPSSNPNFLRI